MMRLLLNSRNSIYIFALAIAVGYCLMPLAFLSLGTNGYFAELSQMAAVASLMLVVGFRSVLSEQRRAHRVELPMDMFVAVVWSAFFVIALIITVTAPAIPLVTALQGGSADLIALQREQFLKSRTGLEAAFPYLNAFFTGALIPYSIGLMFLNKYRARWVLTGAFLFYCLIFTEKAFFFKAALPLVYLYGSGAIKSRFGAPAVVAASVLILIGVTALSGSGQAIEAAQDNNDVLSVTYTPQGVVGHLLWRSFAVPTLTAADAIRVFFGEFGGRPFFGGTSSFLAPIFGAEHVYFERAVFEAQWGQNETGTGSSNSVFVTEAFVNFGWIGVIIFSLTVGRMFRWIADSDDAAMHATWPLLAIGLYSAGLIGILFSNGFIALILLSIFARFKPHMGSPKLALERI